MYMYVSLFATYINECSGEGIMYIYVSLFATYINECSGEGRGHTCIFMCHCLLQISMNVVEKGAVTPVYLCVIVCYRYQ